MRRWGFVISAFYAVLVVSLFLPAWLRLAGESWSDAYKTVLLGSEAADYQLLFGPVFVVPLIIGQALLLFISVDTSWRHVRPRQHIALSAALVGFFVALLALALVSCIWAAIGEPSLFEAQLSPWRERTLEMSLVLWLVGLWTLWGVAFYVYYRGAPLRMAEAVSWLMASSVLELLVAVPTHVIVRRRDDCSAPLVTGFGIATGIAVMLACFGPGVLTLYKKRLERYRVDVK